MTQTHKQIDDERSCLILNGTLLGKIEGSMEFTGKLFGISTYIPISIDFVNNRTKIEKISSLDHLHSQPRKKE